jgi:hypothetical protein
MLRAGFILSALIAALWLIAVVVVAVAAESDSAGYLSVAIYTNIAVWGLALVWIAVAFGSLAIRAVRYFAKPS